MDLTTLTKDELRSCIDVAFDPEIRRMYLDEAFRRLTQTGEVGELLDTISDIISGSIDGYLKDAGLADLDDCSRMELCGNIMTDICPKIEAQLRRRMTPAPTGEVGELLDDIGDCIVSKQKQCDETSDKFYPMSSSDFDYMEDVLQDLRAAFAALQSDRDEWRERCRGFYHAHKLRETKDGHLICWVCGSIALWIRGEREPEYCTNPTCPAVEARAALEAENERD